MKKALSAGLLLFAMTSLHADIYKLVDEHGRVTYSNLPLKGGKKVDLDPISTLSPNRAATGATPANFPKVDGDTQRKRDDMRRKILEDELKTEQASLIEARQTAAEGEAVRLGDERNYQKYLDRVQKLKDNVNLHEKNVEALKKELASLK